MVASIIRLSFGAPGWTSVVGDWNPAVPGMKIGVYQNGVWYLDWNGNGAWDQGIDKAYSFGDVGWTSVVGDWNPAVPGMKIGVYQNGVWYLDWNGNGAWDQGIDKAYSFGDVGWTSVVGDWNGNGQTSVGVYQNGMWYLDNDDSGTWTDSDKAYTFGDSGLESCSGEMELNLQYYHFFSPSYSDGKSHRSVSKGHFLVYSFRYYHQMNIGNFINSNKITSAHRVLIGKSSIFLNAGGGNGSIEANEIFSDSYCSSIDSGNCMCTGRRFLIEGQV